MPARIDSLPRLLAPGQVAATISKESINGKEEVEFMSRAAAAIQLHDC